MRQVDFAGRVRVRIDAHDASKLKGKLVPAPIEIKTPRIGVYLHGDAMGGAGLQIVSIFKL